MHKNACIHRSARLWVLLALVGCQAVPVSTPTTAPTSAPPIITPTTMMTVRRTPVESSRTVVPPTAAPAPTITPTPNVTPDVGITGPYLAFRNADNTCHQTLVVVDQDGDGVRRVPLPRYCDYRSDLKTAVSPDGRYLAAYYGAARSETGNDDLSLTVVDLSSGWMMLDLPLVSEAFPDDFMELYRTEIVSDESGHGDYYDQVEQAAIAAMQIVRWSPNGRYLAFGSQADGPSTDLYVYDTQTYQVRRLSNGHEQIVSIEWSPDGRRILSGSSNDFLLAYPTIHYYVTDLQADGNVAVGGGSQASAHWLDTTHVYAFSQGSPAAAIDGLPLADGTITDAATGQAVTVWSGPYVVDAFSWLDRHATLAGCPPDTHDIAACGVFDVNLDTGEVIHMGPYQPPDIGEENVRPTGLLEYDDQDGNYLLVDANGYYEIHSIGHGLLNTPRDPVDAWWNGIERFILGPFDRHAFVLRDRTLFAVDTADGSMRAVADSIDASSFSYTWLPVAPDYTDISVGSEPAPIGATP